MPQIGKIELSALNGDDSRRVAELPIGWGYGVPVELVKDHILRGADPRGLREQRRFQSPSEHLLLERLAAQQPEIHFHCGAGIDRIKLSAALERRLNGFFLDEEVSL